MLCSRLVAELFMQCGSWVVHVCGGTVLRLCTTVPHTFDGGSNKAVAAVGKGGCGWALVGAALRTYACPAWRGDWLLVSVGGGIGLGWVHCSANTHALTVDAVGLSADVVTPIWGLCFGTCRLGDSLGC
jgi:hypothetical protein